MNSMDLQEIRIDLWCGGRNRKLLENITSRKFCVFDLEATGSDQLLERSFLGVMVQSLQSIKL